MMQRKKIHLCGIVLLTFAFIHLAHAGIAFPIYLVTTDNTQGKYIGTITAEDSFCGVLLIPNLQGLPAGLHAFHVHENPSCADSGMAAGNHYDPIITHTHSGPFNQSGHLGDLPVLIVGFNGKATLPTLAPRIKLKDILGRSFVIHVGGDNYADYPDSNGGGGPRIACGIIKAP